MFKLKPPNDGLEFIVTQYDLSKDQHRVISECPWAVVINILDKNPA